MKLTKQNYVKSILYYKELGDLLAVFLRDGVMYLVCWADVNDNCDTYIVARIEQSVLDAYYAKQITGFDIQKQASELYTGVYSEDGNEMHCEPTTFAEMVDLGFAMAEGTSFYDETLAANHVG